jgi:hypothetical protein
VGVVVARIVTVGVAVGTTPPAATKYILPEQVVVTPFEAQTYQEI